MGVVLTGQRSGGEAEKVHCALAAALLESPIDDLGAIIVMTAEGTYG